MVSGFVDLFFTGYDLFLCFYQARGKRRVFHSSLQTENYFGQVIFKPEVCKSFVTLFYHMSICPLPSSVWYLQWRVQLSPSVIYSVLSATSWPFACILCTVLEAGTVYVIFSAQMFPENQASRVPGEVEHPKTLFDMLHMNKSEFWYLKIVYSLIIVYTVPKTSTVCTHLEMAWELSFQNPRRI